MLALAGAYLLAASPAPARAQASELRLDSSGQWVQTAAPSPGTDGTLFAQARRDLADGRPDAAYDAISPWIDANERSSNPMLARAYLIRADALTALGKEHKALYDYDKGVIEKFPGTEEYMTAVERELEIAVRYVNGLKYRFLGVRILDGADVGEELLIRVQERLPGSRLAERAGIELADYYYRNSEMKLADLAYELFLQNYPDSPYRQRAMERRVYASIAQYKGPSYSGATLVDAQVLVQRYAGIFPAEAARAGLDDALVTRLEESAAAELLDTARWYLKRSDPVSARYTLTRLLAAHPRTPAAADALDIMDQRGWTAPPPSAPPAAGATPAGPAPEAPRTSGAPEHKP